MNRTTLITGASSGIGLSIAKRLDGTVIVNGSNPDKVEEACAALGQRAIPFVCDLTDPIESRLKLISIVNDNNLKIHGFVHSAAVTNPVPLRAINIESHSALFNINVNAAMIFLQTLINKKINADNLKACVLISSNVSNFGAKGLISYAMSKAALDSMARSVAVELHSRLRINSVCPGAVITEMAEKLLTDEKKEKLLEQYPSGFGKPHQVAELVNFLLSDNSSWITGQNLVIDGGRTVNLSV